MRINGLDTAWGTEDLLMARGAGVDAILLPKVESAEAVRQVAVALSEMDAPESLAIWAMIETPRGIRDVEAIAARCASQRLAALAVGRTTSRCRPASRQARGGPNFCPG